VSASVEDLRAILAAYKQVVEASWPELHPAMRDRSVRWGRATGDELKTELAGYVADASEPTCKVRLFWKVAPQFEFGGCNAHFAQDAGFASAAEMVGLTDFDKRIPWRPQAAKYRQDDEAIVANKTAQLNIIERQKAPNGDISWVRVGKVPIQRTDGAVIGILGMYEVLDAATGRKLHGESLRRSGS
jgi:hypothetical protein